MLDHLIGLVLLGLGVNTTPFNPNVKGDDTVVSSTEQEAEDEHEFEPLSPDEAGNAGTLPGPRGLREQRTIKNQFRLNSEEFHFASDAGIGRKVRLDARAFGKGVLRMHEDFADQFEASREAAKQEFEARRESFKQQLELIKDTKKQAVVERLNTNCQNINEKRTDKMSTMLAKLSSILTNVSNKTASAAADGKDTSSVETAITEAQTAISNAQTLVTEQAGATCEITITDEDSLKTDVGETISGLQENLKTVYESVITARQKVGAAIKTLAGILGESL